MAYAKLYTYAQAPVPGLVKSPKDPFMAAGYASGLPGVNFVVHGVAALGAAVASAVLAEAHARQDLDYSSNPRIELSKGDRTDYHILLVAEGRDEEDAIHAALTIERGRSMNTRNPMQGVGALRAAMDAMGG